jgi:plasmid stability protein
MPALNVRNLSEATHHALRLRAAEHGRSMEAEIRAILDDAVRPKAQPRLGTLLSAIGEEFGGVELNLKRDPHPVEAALFE